jgi:hypothetical protein
VTSPNISAKRNLQFLVDANKHGNQIHLTNLAINIRFYQFVVLEFILFSFMNGGGRVRMLILQVS